MATNGELLVGVVHEVDGHDPDELRTVLEGLPTQDGLPHVIHAHTLSGKGVSFMEGKVDWHYLPLSDEQYSRGARGSGGIGKMRRAFCRNPL